MKKREIYCEACNREIKYRDELVVTTVFFSMVAYHDACFSKSLKGPQTLFVSNQPINGVSGTITSIISFIAALVFLFFNILSSYSLIGLFLLVVPAYRVFSWFTFERYLE